MFMSYVFIDEVFYIRTQYEFSIAKQSALYVYARSAAGGESFAENFSVTVSEVN